MVRPIKSHTSARRAKLLSAVCLLVAVGAAAVGAHAWLSPTAPRRPPAEQKEEQIEAELVTATPDGFDPAEITRPKGSFYLVVDNLAGLPELNLRLTGEAGHSLHEARVPRGQADWTALLDLNPGTYVLREAEHPGWECRITVTP